MRDFMDGSGRAAASTSSARASAQAGIGNIIIQNQIVVPSPGEDDQTGPGGRSASAADRTTGAGEVASAGGTSSKPRRKGRKPDTDSDDDRRIAEAWATGRYKTYAELDRAVNLPAGHAKRAVDRHRHRTRK